MPPASRFALCFALCAALVASGDADDFPFRNVSLPWSERVKDLIDRLTIPELVQQLSKGGGGPFGGPAPAIPRLGIGPYQWNTECLRGAVQAGSATSFPQAIGLAATFDTELLARVARATGLELRAKHNDFVRQSKFTDHTGASCFAPVINILRHPLWGRNQETYGEDPFLSGSLAEAFVRALQGHRPGHAERYLLAGAGCKHFAAYDGPDSFPVSRFGFNAVVSEQDLQQTFLPQFRRCVEAGSRSVMCSYNAINGVPACGNRRLLTDILRGDWKFDGYVISDAGALEFAIIFHKFFANRLDAAVGSFKAGLNLELSACPYESCVVFEQLAAAANKSLVTADELRAAAAPLFHTRMLLGEFDPPSLNPFAQLTADQFVQSDEHRALSREAAAATFVLLKNSNDFLPNAVGENSRLGVIGPLSDRMSLVYGSYSPSRMPEFENRLLDELAVRFASVSHAVYCLDGVTCTQVNASAVDALERSADIFVAVLGTGVQVETESLDRRTMDLPAGQNALLRALVASGRPVILLVLSGGPVTLDFAASSPTVKAIVWCGFPAQTFGAAVVDVLTGRVSPYAALPFTWYSQDSPLPDITNYAMRNQTYRFANASSLRPLHPFGFGLSYCRVELRSLSLSSSSIRAGDDLNFRVRVASVAKRGCKVVVKAYLMPAAVRDGNPGVWLAALAKIELDAGAEAASDMRVLSREMRLWHAASQALRVLPGNYRLVVGDYFDEQCADCRLAAAFTVTA